MSMSNPIAVHDLDARQLHNALKSGEIVLVDVREPDEHRAERIEGAMNLPLSRFDPATLPEVRERSIVLHCAGGVRSAKALDLCRRQGFEVRGHLAGGLNAWKAAGLPTVR